MSGMRKTPYKYKQHAPDIVARFNKSPHLFTVSYRRKWYRLTTCMYRECRKEYWHCYYSNHGKKRVIGLVTRTYCCSKHSILEQKLLTKERQKRYFRNNPHMVARVRELQRGYYRRTHPIIKRRSK